MHEQHSAFQNAKQVFRPETIFDSLFLKSFGVPFFKVKNPPAMRETWVLSLGWEDPLEKGTSTHSSILAWRIPWTIQSMGSQRVGHNRAHTHAISHCLHDILFIPSSVNGRLTIWVVSTFQLQWIMLLWTRVYKYGPESLLSLLLPRNEIAGFSGNSVFNGVRNHPTAFHNSCTIILMALNTIYQQMNSIQLHTFPEL